MTVYPEDVAAFMGEEVTPAFIKKATAHLEVVRHMVWAYTRGQGFDPLSRQPTGPIVAVIISASARLVRNPTLIRQESVGAFQVSHGLFNGFTLPELAVLNTYRRRTA